MDADNRVHHTERVCGALLFHRSALFWCDGVATRFSARTAASRSRISPPFSAPIRVIADQGWTRVFRSQQARIGRLALLPW